MGYITNDIAEITEPGRVSLSALPNFVQFASKPSTKVYLEIHLTITGTPTVPASLIRITEPNGAVHNFTGTLDPEDVSGPVFLISATPAETAENIRQALLSLDWLKSNFEITIPYVMVGPNLANGDEIHIKSKGTGTEFNLTLAAPDNTGAYTIVVVNAASVNDDSISGEEVTAEIQIDIYDRLGIVLGEPDAPTTPAAVGSYVTSLTKTYAGAPLWFDLNALFYQYQGFKVPVAASGWVDAGTVKGFRLMAKVRGGVPFYQSNALYAVNGYSRLSDTVNMEEYVFTGGIVKLLTNKPRTPYVKGQREYLNFITEKLTVPLEINYRAYTTAGDLLGFRVSNAVSSAALATVNTCILEIDELLDLFPNAGIVRVALGSGGLLVSNDLEYIVRPECLHVLRQFTFLNSLGGWDSFNFDASLKDEIKPTTEIYKKTVTPGYQRGDSVDTVYSLDLANTLTVEGAPVTDEVAEWLKELAASKVVLDQNFYYLIKEDFSLTVTAGSFNMQTPTIKYRLSENYTNG